MIGKIKIHFASPLLGSMISRVGASCGAVGGQVIFLHAAQAQVTFVLCSQLFPIDIFPAYFLASKKFSCILSVAGVRVILLLLNRDLSGGQVVSGVLLSGEGQPPGDKILRKPKNVQTKAKHLQASHLESFLNLGESLQLCELKGNSSGANDLRSEHQQTRQTNNIDNNSKEQNKNNDEKQINGELEKQTIKAECEPGLDTISGFLKEESFQFQDHNKIPSVKNLINIGSKVFNNHGKISNRVESSLTQALFKCDQCESKFQRENLLEIHKSARHGDQPPSPPKKTRKRRSDSRPLPTR